MIRSRRRIYDRGAAPSMESASPGVGVASGRDDLIWVHDYEPTTPKTPRGRGRRLRRNRRRRRSARSEVRQPSYPVEPRALVRAPSTPPRASAFVCPGPPIPPERECYGLWRGEERARLLAYEACVQTCLDGSTSFVRGTVSIRRRHVAVLSQRSMHAQLREAFGLDNVLVSTMGQQCATPEMKSRPTLDKERARRLSASAPERAACRWAMRSIPTCSGSFAASTSSTAVSNASPVDGILANTVGRVSRTSRAVRMSSFARRAVREAPR